MRRMPIQSGSLKYNYFKSLLMQYNEEITAANEPRQMNGTCMQIFGCITYHIESTRCKTAVCTSSPNFDRSKRTEVGILRQSYRSALKMIDKLFSCLYIKFPREKLLDTA